MVVSASCFFNTSGLIHFIQTKLLSSDIISDIYRCSKAKTGMTQPNSAADDDDLIDVIHELTGVEDYPILSENR